MLQGQEERSCRIALRLPRGGSHGRQALPCPKEFASEGRLFDNSIVCFNKRERPPCVKFVAHGPCTD
jgi:hypothetical protein